MMIPRRIQAIFEQEPPGLVRKSPERARANPAVRKVRRLGNLLFPRAWPKMGDIILVSTITINA
jgi:hypothetical protein